jgi:hypothetical protein
MTLAELIASGRATCKIEELQGDIIEAGRCTLYEASEDGGAFADCIIRVGRRKLVALPRLYALLGIPMPDGWLPAGALAECCQNDESGSESDELGTDHHACDACGRADVVAFDSRRHKGSGLRAQASPDRSRGGGRGSSGG